MADVQPPQELGSPIQATPSQIQASLAAAKEARKRAELDAQLLANRIALLKQEEEKAWRKIEETRKRATEIQDLRAKNESKFAAKEQFYKAKWEDIRSSQAVNAEKRDSGRANRDQNRQGLLAQKQQSHAEQKEQSQQLLEQKKGYEAQQLEANNQRSGNIKSKKEEAKRRLEEERLGQLEKFREDYEARTSQEEFLKSRTEALVAKMEKEEMELIQRLQNTQTVQRNAYEELEAALGQTTQQVSSSNSIGSKFQGGAIGGKAHNPPGPRPAA